ncbi:MULTISPECIES: hypothetical protein [unclassified Roseitalea]|uniref:hypothetical protein n=1 Tax=unclassified Roseitalea TaxID=2639107 RepID=UPI00273E118A|nr:MULTISPECIES: hypothetical protein [unclassified Roseitalea]
MGRDTVTDSQDRRLVDAVRQVKIATADRNDVVVDMKEADRARLQILAEELRPVFDEVPLDDERFDFAISSGLQPRLWIDATAHVMMGRDRRTYRFVRDTRAGRVVLAESLSVGPIADRVTLYIAERLHEREMAFAADEIVSFRTGIEDGSRQARASEPRRTAQATERDAEPAEDDRAPPAQPAAAPPPPTPARRESTTAMSTYGWIFLLTFIAIGVLILAFRDQFL